MRSRQAQRVSVVVPTYQGEDRIADQLNALSRQTYSGDLEVVVALNEGHNALTAQLAETRGFRVVSAGRARGVSAARNDGYREATGDLILVCDDDDIVDSGWVAAMVEAAMHADVIGGPLDVDALNDDRVVRRRGRPAVGLPMSHDRLPYAVGANCGAWRDVLDQLGGWREDLVAGDDVDLSWRAARQGFTVGYAPDAVVQYRYRPGIADGLRQNYRYGIGAAQMASIHRIGRRQIWRSARYLAFLLASAPVMLVTGDGGLWMTRTAQLGGRIHGSIRYRVFYV